MRTLTKLFGRSPFVALQIHMNRVGQCVDKARPLVDAFLAGNSSEVADLADDIAQLEHMADEVKRDIQDNLHKGMFMSVDRSKLLEILAVQDSIADKVENIGVLLTIKPMSPPEGFLHVFNAFLDKNLEAFNACRGIVDQLQDLAASSFGGAEAQKISNMVNDVSALEQEADQIQHNLLRELFAHENLFTHGEFYLWTQVFRQIGEIANISERLANRIRLTLERK